MKCGNCGRTLYGKEKDEGLCVDCVRMIRRKESYV
jgi:hypothetical protein